MKRINHNMVKITDSLFYYTYLDVEEGRFYKVHKRLPRIVYLYCKHNEYCREITKLSRIQFVKLMKHEHNWSIHKSMEYYKHHKKIMSELIISNRRNR